MKDLNRYEKDTWKEKRLDFYDSLRFRNAPPVANITLVARQYAGKGTHDRDNIYMVDVTKSELKTWLDRNTLDWNNMFRDDDGEIKSTGFVMCHSYMHQPITAFIRDSKISIDLNKIQKEINDFKNK